MASVKLNRAELAAILTGPNSTLGRDLVRRGRQVEREAVRLCPVNTGNLRSSITTEFRQQGDRLQVRVGTNVDYALPVHEGSRPHVIRPRSKKALVFVWPGAPSAVAAAVPRSRRRVSRQGKSGPLVAFRYVNHPGTKARPFLRLALERFNP